MYECINCGQKAVIWKADHAFEDLGIEGEGIVHFYECQNCGAEIEYYVEEKNGTED